MLIYAVYGLATMGAVTIGLLVQMFNHLPI